MFKDKSLFNVVHYVYQPMAGNVVSKVPWWLYAINPFLTLVQYAVFYVVFIY